MTEFKLVLNDPKTGKSYQRELKSPDADNLVGKKVKDLVKGELFGLTGYEFEITGGTDKDGFPIKPSVHGPKRVRLLLSKGIGFQPETGGYRKKKGVRGEIISSDIVQINMRITKYGAESLEPKKEEKKE